MTIAPLVVIALVFGAVAAVVADRGGTASFTALGGLALVVVMGMVLPVAPGDSMLAGEPVRIDGYVRLFLVFGGVGGLLLMLLHAVAPPDPSAPALGPRHAHVGAAFLPFLGGAALALAIPSPLPALVAATAAGLAGMLAAARDATDIPEPIDSARQQGATRPAAVRTMSGRLGADVLRSAVALALAVSALALLAGGADVIAGEPVGVGAAALGLAAAVGLRIGIVPLHAHAARLAESAVHGAVPILSIWGPTLFAVVALAAVQAAVVPLGLPLSMERGIIAGLGLVTVALAGLGALVQDDVDHVVAYSILQDAGFAMLAFTATDAAGWGAGRTWLLVFAISKTALLGWSAVLVRTFGTRSLADLHGWARRAPLLGVALAVVAVATVGVPGFASFDARLALVSAPLGEPLRWLVLGASLVTLLVHGRLLVIGLLEPTGQVRAGADERLRRLRPDPRRRVSVSARETFNLNRVPVAAGLAIALALVAFSAGADLFGLHAAAAENLPAALPGGQPSTVPAATFRPVPTESPPASSPLATASPPVAS